MHRVKAEEGFRDGGESEGRDRRRTSGSEERRHAAHPEKKIVPRAPETSGAISESEQNQLGKLSALARRSIRMKNTPAPAGHVRRTKRERFVNPRSVYRIVCRSVVSHCEPPLGRCCCLLRLPPFFFYVKLKRRRTRVQAGALMAASGQDPSTKYREGLGRRREACNSDTKPMARG